METVKGTNDYVKVEEGKFDVTEHLGISGIHPLYPDQVEHIDTYVYEGFLSKVDPKFIFKGKTYSLTKDGVEVLRAGGANKQNSLVIEKVWY